MADQPPPYVKGDPSVLITGGYQQVGAQPQNYGAQPQNYGATPTTTAYQQGYQQGYQQDVPYTATAQSPVVVTQQPGGSGPNQYYNVKPSNFIALSVLNMICCCFIMGIIALIFGMQVDSAWAAGNYDEAKRSANMAKILNFIGLGVGIALWAFFGIIIIASIVIVVNNPNYTPST